MIIKDAETRENILAGMEVLYDFVKTTMGPKGRNVIIIDKFGGMTLTHDGVTAARAVLADKSLDPKLMAGIKLLAQGSEKLDLIGDGTTSVEVLGYHLTKELMSLIDNGANPMVIARQLGPIADDLIAKVQAKSKVIKQTPKAVLDVAKISAADEEIAQMISELVVATGYNGAITVETVHGEKTFSTLTEGYRLLSGYSSPQFVTDTATREAILDGDVGVFLIDGSMSNMETYSQAIIEAMNTLKLQKLLFICSAIDPEVETVMIINHAKSFRPTNPDGTKDGFKVIVAKNYYGREYLEDIAAFTGAMVFNPNVEDTFLTSQIGKAQKVISTAAETIIFGGFGSTEEQLQKLASIEPTPETNRRIQALNAKIGIIKVGGITPTAAEEKKHRVDDAVGATRAALEGGIVAGGGTTLRDIGNNLEHKDEITEAVYAALLSPEEILVSNSGYTLPQHSVDAIVEFEVGKGINVHTGKTVDMLKSGIVDPTMVTVEVIRAAFGVAADAITAGGASIDDAISQEELARLMGLSQK